MNISVFVLYDKGEKLDAPVIKTGDLKRYQDKTRPYSKPYLMLRDDTGASLLPPLYNYDDIFMKDGGQTVIYRGNERVKTPFGVKEYLQEWEVQYCTDPNIMLKIQEHISGAERIHRGDDSHE